jgi:hypothetical protein
VTNISSHDPVVWDNSGTPIDLASGSPAGLTNGAAFAVSGNFVVGAAEGSASGGYAHAIRWNFSGGSALDLNPAGYQGSNAYSIAGNQIVGSAHLPGGQQNAALWDALTGAFTNLNPAGFTNSIINATTGTEQVGYGTGPAGGPHALLWHGSPGTAVDLNAGNPLGFSGSFAHNAGGGQQVGVAFGSPSGATHAVLWSGTAASMVDLHPMFGGFLLSEAYATNGTQQVGYSRLGNDHHAFLWSGSAASAVDLHLQLPAGYTSSDAWSIDGAGNVFGLATDSSGNYHFVEWAAVPEPTGITLSCLVALPLCRRRSRTV